MRYHPRPRSSPLHGQRRRGCRAGVFRRRHTSLNETHGDWTVACATRDGVARCAITQTQVSGENRQRVLSVQIAAVENGAAAEGVLVLPFGLRLDAGVRLAIDEKRRCPSAASRPACRPIV
ncbi:invasion associated locus B family protein [Stappia sp. P2PMeth1]|uniref:invasion associated locus B family protein n=1 Tax=Stappia sp. P2PMeth1 TaxID=2003586 RepID=UPI001646BB68